MIVALFALSAALVIGGIAAVIQGFPFVRLESGLAMVIAGATVASAGTVVFGLAVVATGLRRVARAFDARRIVDAVGTLQDGMHGPALGALPDRGPAAPPPGDPAPATRPALPEPGAALAAPVAAAGLLAGQSRTEPTFAEPGPLERAYAPVADGAHASEAFAREAFAPEIPPADAYPLRLEPAEPELPLPGLTPPEPAAREPTPEPVPAPAPSHAPEDDLFAAPEPALRPGLDAEPLPELVAEPEPSPEPAPAAAAPEPRAVVGRYASGGNTYVMFADGSIEAETPQGRFSFASLDELKAFVDGGGEAGARGAA